MTTTYVSIRALGRVWSERGARRAVVTSVLPFKAVHDRALLHPLPPSSSFFFFFIDSSRIMSTKIAGDAWRYFFFLTCVLNYCFATRVLCLFLGVRLHLDAANC